MKRFKAFAHGRSGSLTVTETVEPSHSAPLSTVAESRPSTSSNGSTRTRASFSGRLPQGVPKAGLTRVAFRRSLEDARFLHKFGRWLASQYSAELLLFWISAEQHRQELVRLVEVADRLGGDHSPSFLATMTPDELQQMRDKQRAVIAAEDPFSSARDNAFDQLYQDHYPAFLQYRVELLRQRNMSDGSTSASGQAALACSWIVAPPDRDSRQSVLMASEAVMAMTGHANLCGSPWTIVQGTHSDEGTRRIRAACEAGKSAQELLLSFKADGTPFHHLLRTQPLRGKRNGIDAFLFSSWDVSSLVTAGPHLDALLSDELDEPGSGEMPFDEHLKRITDDAIAARLKRQEARHLPPSISAGTESETQVKATTIETLRATALRPPTSGAGAGMSSLAAALPAEVEARQHAVADEVTSRYVILDRGGEHITHADPLLAPCFVSGTSFAASAERASSGLASRVRQAAKRGQPTVMHAMVVLPEGRRVAHFSLVPCLDATGKVATIVLSFLPAPSSPSASRPTTTNTTQTT